MKKQTLILFAFIGINAFHANFLSAYGPGLNNPYQYPSSIYQNYNNQRFNQPYTNVQNYYNNPAARAQNKLIYRYEEANQRPVYIPQDCPYSSYYADYQPGPCEANFILPPKGMGREHAFKSGGASGSGAAGVGAASAGVGSGGIGGGMR